jgi:hypothetical protein
LDLVLSAGLPQAVATSGISAPWLSPEQRVALPPHLLRVAAKARIASLQLQRFDLVHNSSTGTPCRINASGAGDAHACDKM